MSSWDQSYTETLQASPFRVDPASHHLVRYAPHPSRPGYIFLVTDLVSVYTEVLTAPSVPSRLAEVRKAGLSSKHDGAIKGKSKNKSRSKADEPDEDDEEDMVARTERTLSSLSAVFERWEGLKLDMQDHDYHDKVLHLRTKDFAWLFNLTELKGREPLALISQLLLGPLARVLAQDADPDVHINASFYSCALLPGDGAADAWPAAYASQSSAKPIDILATLLVAPSVAPRLIPPPEEEAEEGSYDTSPPPKSPSSKHRTQVKSPARSKQPKRPSATDDEAGPTQDSSTSDQPVSAKKPKPRRKARRISDEADSMSDQDAQSSLRAVKSKVTRHPDAAVTAGTASTSSQSPHKSQPASQAITATADGSELGGPDPGASRDEDEDEDSDRARSKKQTKREREAEEDAEVERRLGEIRRKMGKGGGGRLGRRMR